MGFFNNLIMIVLLFTSLFLIVLILIQRGKGGGLAGAFGGMGGQSAFGTKAGDTFTKITVGVAAFWILLCMLMVFRTRGGNESPLNPDLGGAAQTEAGMAAPPEAEKKAGGETATEKPAEQPAAPAETPAPAEETPQK